MQRLVDDDTYIALLTVAMGNDREGISKVIGKFTPAQWKEIDQDFHAEIVLSVTPETLRFLLSRHRPDLDGLALTYSVNERPELTEVLREFGWKPVEI